MGQSLAASRHLSSASAGTGSALIVDTPSLTLNTSGQVFSQAPTPAQRFVSTLALTTGSFRYRSFTSTSFPTIRGEKSRHLNRYGEAASHPLL